MAIKSRLNYFFVLFVSSFFLAVDLHAQNFEYEIVTTWDSESNHCFPCDFDASTNTVFSSKTIQLPVKGSVLLDATIMQLEYVDIVLPSQYNKSFLPNNPNIKTEFGQSRFENYLITTFNPIVN